MESKHHTYESLVMCPMCNEYTVPTVFAAAPDLLAACKAAYLWDKHISKELQELLRAAIAKAEGGE